MKLKLDRLQIILKTVERCNIACTYCYYFFAGDDSYKNRPPLISKNVINKTTDFLFSALNDIDIKELQIVFHGGEPLLQKKKDFDYMCRVFSERLAASVNLIFTVQTNGMLIDEEWIQLFEKYNVNVGVSLDGEAAENDRNRIDHKGRGTYDRVVSGLQKLVIANKELRLSKKPALLTVVNHESNYKKIINHFVDDLNVKNIGVLLPDISHDDKLPEGATSEDYGNRLFDIFDAVMEKENINVKSVTKVLDFFQQKKMSVRGLEKKYALDQFIEQGGKSKKNQIIVIQSNGDISLDDSFTVALRWRTSQEVYSIHSISLAEYLSLPVFEEIRLAYTNLPKKCEECSWVKICGGGELENRYKEGNGFNQPSVYCDGLSKYYRHATTYLYKNGYPKELIIEKLGAPE